MSTILGNPITLGGGGSKVPDYTYTGNAEWYNAEKTILKLKTSGVLTLSKDCIADVFCVGGGGSGNVQRNSNRFSGAGGGGGYTTTRRVSFIKGTQYNAIIGAGGAAAVSTYKGNDGGTTSINEVSASGGKGAVTKTLSGYSASPGGDGGSGGGASGSNGGNGGTNGANGSDSSGSYLNPGGIGQGTTTRAFGESSFEAYAGGGGGGSYRKGTGGTGGGNSGGTGGGMSSYSGGDGVDNTGGGGGGGDGSGERTPSGSGGSGVILIRFAS